MTNLFLMDFFINMGPLKLISQKEYSPLTYLDLPITLLLQTVNNNVSRSNKYKGIKVSLNTGTILPP